MSEEFDSVLAAVGPRLRELRRRRGASLTALSQTTGIPVSALSRLESGHRKPGRRLSRRLTAAVGAISTDLDFCVGSCSRALARAP
jgi:transcriptional regulator with XRE-family HTH domain